MPVHPQIAGFLATLPPSDANPPDVLAWRAQGESHLPPIEERIELHLVEDSSASSSFGEVPVRIYTPRQATVYDILVYFHGGAFFSGSIETHDAIARSLAKESGYKVISVGYRLAPENLYPAGLEDCYAVVEWIAKNRDALQWSGSRLALAGDSSGGTFVAAVCGMAIDSGLDVITDQVLLYPSVDLDFDEDRYYSLRENATGKGLETIALKPHNSFYISSGADPSDPLVSPIKRNELTGMPRALVITAEYDPLRDEGEAYAKRLMDSGVEVELKRYLGATHGFVQYFGWLPEYALVFSQVARFLS